MPRSIAVVTLLTVLCAIGCIGRPTLQDQKMPVVTYFEIPVSDLDRAIDFYVGVLGMDFEKGEIDGHPMAFFPPAGDGGVTGALVTGKSYVPSVDGTRVYFRVADIDAVLGHVKSRGAAVLYPKTDIGPAGQVAEFQDSEGNRIAIIQPR